MVEIDPWVGNLFNASVGVPKRLAVVFKVAQAISIGLRIDVTRSAFLSSIEGSGDIVAVDGIRTFLHFNENGDYFEYTISLLTVKTICRFVAVETTSVSLKL